MTSVAILGMGSSLSQYFQDYAAKDCRPTDEAWGINSVAAWLHPKLLTMGLALDNFNRDQKMDGGKYEQYVADIVGSGLPIMADVEYPEWPHVQAYPFKDVIADIWPDAKSEADILPDIENTINAATALAIHRKFDEIHLYGCDFRSGDDAYRVAAVADALEDIKPRWFVYHNREIVRGRRDLEPGEPCTMWLLGVAHARGIKVKVCRGSTLMNQDRGRYVYGPQEPPEIFEKSPEIVALEEATKAYNTAVQKFNGSFSYNDKA